MAGIALCMTVKNEATLIRANLLYHQHLGVERAYIYLDGTEDDTAARIQDLHFVRMGASVPASALFVLGYNDATGKRIAREHAGHHCARQMLNMLDAYHRAEREGLDWLICIDADELVCPLHWMMHANAIAAFLEAQPDAVEMVNFRPLECLQYAERHERVVFAEAELFKVIVDSHGDPLPTADALRRRMPDTKEGMKLETPPYYGHTQGKVAVRTGGDLLPATVHGFRRRSGVAPNVQNTRCLLHYVTCSLDDFIKKHRNFAELPDHWVSGAAVDPHIRAWIDLVNTSSSEREVIADYYRRWILFSAEEIRRLGELHPSPIIRISLVPRVFQELGDWSTQSITTRSDAGI